MKTDVFLPPPRHSRFRFPGPRDRVTINGKTGSGKSTFALWLLAESGDYDKKPWIILDFKGEEIVQECLKKEIFKPLAVTANIPNKNGIYVVKHDPRGGMSPVSDLLWRIYQRGDTGLFLDEATMVPELRGEANSGGPFQSILSQGRSKRIPTYVLAQRPVNVNKMVFSENSFYSVFRLTTKDDLKRVAANIPEDSHNYAHVWNEKRLPAYWSRWYDDEQDMSFILRPAPPADATIKIFAERLDNGNKHRVVG